MTGLEARSALTTALINPAKARESLSKIITNIEEAVPQALTTAGAFLISEWLSKKFTKTPTDIEADSVKIPVGIAGDDKSAGESIEPPENYGEWQKQMKVDDAMRQSSETNARGMLRRFLAGKKA